MASALWAIALSESPCWSIASHLKLTSVIRVDQPLNIIGHSEQVYRLISNLIINAIQYTPKGGKITIVLDRTEHYAVIQVEDTGIGIPQTELSRIFDRFYRVNSDRLTPKQLFKRTTAT